MKTKEHMGIYKNVMIGKDPIQSYNPELAASYLAMSEFLKETLS
jgi:hypothetical protein